MSFPAGPPTHHVVLYAARALTPDHVLTPARIELDSGGVVGVEAGERGPSAAATVIDLGNRTVVPGFVDVHVHGGGGAQVSGDDADEVAEQIATLAALHTTHGTTALVATTVAESPQRLRAAVAGVARAKEVNDTPRALILGAHLEGPWIAPGRAGAHDPSALRDPDPDELAALIDASAGAIRLMTIAPELPRALDVMQAAVDAGISVSVGHTDANVDQVQAAIEAGARHATHLFNAMPELAHRAPGPVGALLADERVTVEVIADGHHLHPAVLSIVGVAAAGRVAAVTDATAATGLAEGRYRLGQQDVEVHGDRVTLTGRETLAGSVLTMDRAVRTLCGAGWSLSDAITAATRVPADSVRAAGKGRLAPGADADLVVLEPNLAVAAVLIGGDVAHDPHRLFERITRTE